MTQTTPIFERIYKGFHEVNRTSQHLQNILLLLSWHTLAARKVRRKWLWN